uniref:N-acetylgalactosaminide beta-1,3-galactosyltransferase n=1 Tax=Rhabditophanes sp. KR3021 TaxID=114890 RepID=A0AC35UEP0_9BILA
MREFMDKEYKNDELERLRLYRNSPLNEEASGINDIQDKAVLSFNHDHEKDETSVGKAIRKKVRILCWIMTHTNNTYKKAINIAETWGKKCTKLIFISVDPKSNLTTVDLNVPDGRNFLWQKTKKSFKYLYENELNNYDWFLKGKKYTYCYLRYMLLGYSPKTPVFFGCRFKKYLTQGYNSGAGYILSREALKRFVEIALKDPKKCKRHDNGAEDLEMGRCLQNVGVVAGDSRDSLGRHRMVPFDPLFHLRGDSHNVKSTKT